MKMKPLKRGIHTTLLISTHTWLTNEAAVQRTTLSAILEKAIQVYKTYRHYDPPN